MSALPLYDSIAVFVGLYMLLFTLANIIYFKFKDRRPEHTGEIKVSVLIPARNEAKRIIPALEGLKNQTCKNYEVIVLDDNSEDNTYNTVLEYSRKDSRFTVLKGKPLPEGWKGKPFAMKQLAEKADGEILIFMDADMRPEANFISWVVTNFQSHKVDFLSGYPRHTSPEKQEYFLFPVMYLATSFLLPLWLFNKVRTYMFSHAIGQFFCIKKQVLLEAGGFEKVRNKINEDIQMARYLKKLGYKQVFLDGKKYIHGNMYDSMNHAKMGIIRVVYEYFENKVYPFVFMGVVIILFLILPLPLSLYLFISGGPWYLSAVSVLLVFSAWAVTMIDRRLPWYVAFLYPVHFIWVIILSVSSIFLFKKGSGYLWKGRIVK